MRVLVMHRIPDSFAHYARNIDHDLHEVTYVSAPDRAATLPTGVRATFLDRPGTGDTADEVLAAVAGLPAPDVLVAMSEYDLLAAGRVRDALGVPGPGEADVLPVRDKVLMKAAAEAGGLRTPRYLPLGDALAGGPSSVPWKGRTVLKPLSGASSEGVSDYPDVASALEAGRAVDAAGHEIEEFVDGPIVHLDGLMHGGELGVVVTSKYVGTCLRYAALGEPLGSVQIATPPPLAAWATRALRAVGIHDGPFHLEVILAAEGPVFLEVGARVGGADIVDAVELATGVHLQSAQVRQLVGSPLGSGPSRDPGPGPDERYAFFMFPGHTLGSRHCRITGEDPFRASPLVHRWVQRTPDEPIKDTITYADSDIPVAGVLGPATADELTDFMLAMFTTIKIHPAPEPGEAS
ncbi:hypothetical protein LO762_30070 [Actinocorallia sp. API 0066]|uniref:ATP-grasp domain-containing protein n=1 Tax=Actinocorallia sp. API 0066 TaxID=2896846 RepID=UPI001E6400F8|nr:hypothetical protein [Actinocorallia sp. API 0066]MCD0453396.1 hypothetical protein [Actinocorallia sp. API 0066]